MSGQKIIQRHPLDKMGSRSLAVIRVEKGEYELVMIQRKAMYGGDDGASRDIAIRDLIKEANDVDPQ